MTRPSATSSSLRTMAAKQSALHEPSTMVTESFVKGNVSVFRGHVLFGRDTLGKVQYQGIRWQVGNGSQESVGLKILQVMV